MKRYRIRKNSFLWYAQPWAVFILMVLAMGLGNHFIDGI